MTKLNSDSDVSSRELLQFLEQATGRRLQSHEDIRNFLRDLALKDPKLDPGVRHWQTAKQGAWLFMLVVAFLQYYLFDVVSNAFQLQSIVFTVPPSQVRVVRT